MDEEDRCRALVRFEYGLRTPRSARKEECQGLATFLTSLSVVSNRSNELADMVGWDFALVPLALRNDIVLLARQTPGTANIDSFVVGTSDQRQRHAQVLASKDLALSFICRAETDMAQGTFGNASCHTVGMTNEAKR